MFTNQFTEYKLPLFEDGVRLPEIKISKDEKEELKLKEDSSNEEFLKRKVWKLCLEKIEKGEIKQNKEFCIDRLKEEFLVFKKTNTIDYILFLMDIFLWCDKNNIPRGPGRGSAAGSLTLYILGLTSVNPLDYNLSFTRFLNEARAKTHIKDGVTYVDGKSFADFDGDISFLKRSDVIRRIEKDYPSKTCKILTLQYLTGKMALKDTVKSYLEYSEDQALEITSEIETLFGKVDSLSKTYEKKKKFKEWVDKNKETYDIARKLEGLLRTTGQHASGVLAGYYNLNEIIPMEAAASDEIVSGYDMEVALTISLKADLLGLRTLDLLQLCSEFTGINYKDIDINSKEVYDYFQRSTDFYGLFQIEEGATKEVTKQIMPKNIKQLAACISISRPGALKQVPSYCSYVHENKTKNIHPKIDEVLKETGMILLYQEQINSICETVYKMDPISADDVRRCIGKKDSEGIKKWEPIIYGKGEENNIPKEATDWFWQTVQSSADYLFNKNHCLSPDTIVETKNGYKSMFEIRAGEYIKAFNTKAKSDEYVKVLNIMENKKELYEVELDDGRKIRTSMDHKFLTQNNGMQRLEDIIAKKYKIITD